MRKIIIITSIISTANILLIGYIYGYRLANFSEIPNSQRPSGLFTNASMDMIGVNYANAE